MRPIAAVQMLVFDVLEMTATDPKQPVTIVALRIRE